MFLELGVRRDERFQERAGRRVKLHADQLLERRCARADIGIVAVVHELGDRPLDIAGCGCFPFCRWLSQHRSHELDLRLRQLVRFVHVLAPHGERAGAERLLQLLELLPSVRKHLLLR
jgi:hypothetical protein